MTDAPPADFHVDEALAARLEAWREKQTGSVAEAPE